MQPQHQQPQQLQLQQLQTLSEEMAVQDIDPTHKQQINELEQQIFQQNDYDPKYLNFYDHTLYYKGNQYLRVLQINKSSQKNTPKPILVLIHGYGGSLITFINLLKSYQERYHIYAIDLLGMGSSSRPKFNITDFEQTIQFFIQPIKIFITDILAKQNTFDKVYILAHSLGAYLSTFLVRDYPELVQNLYLLSPPGVTWHKEDDINKLTQRYNEMTFSQRMKFSFFIGLFRFFQLTPQGVYRNFGKLFGYYFIKKGLINRLNIDPERKDFPLLLEYFKKLYLLPKSSCLCLYNILQVDVIKRLTAKLSIQQMIVDNLDKFKDVKIVFFYGDHDWMDKQGARELAEYMQNISFYLVDDSSHHLNMQNPEFILRYCRLEEYQCQSYQKLLKTSQNGK